MFIIKIRFHWQAFIVYKNGENLKILTEIFCQKLTDSNVILASANHSEFSLPWIFTQRVFKVKTL